MNRDDLLFALADYQTLFADETAFVPMFRRLLRDPRAYFRDHLPGHMTGSSWIIDRSRHFVLLTHHAALNRWLQPGGHADGDENIEQVALKEAEEETGISEFQMLSKGIFDIDIHRIPARNDFPEHDHYDVRILLEANKEHPLHVTGESHALEWIAASDLGQQTGNNRSMLRMAHKVRSLFTSQ